MTTRVQQNLELQKQGQLPRLVEYLLLAVLVAQRRPVSRPRYRSRLMCCLAEIQTWWVQVAANNAWSNSCRPRRCGRRHDRRAAGVALLCATTAAACRPARDL